MPGGYQNISVDALNLMIIGDEDMQKLAVEITDAYREVGAYSE